jgi:outer membrane protein assembly factor BamB
MKKKLFAFTLLVMVFVSSYGQSNSLIVLHNEKVIGKNLVLNDNIKAVEHLFPERIHDYYLDTISEYLTIQLRGVSRNGKYLNNAGDVVQYDLKNRRVAWDKRIAYQSSFLQQFGNTIIQTTANKSFCLDLKTGENIWEVKNNIYFVDPVEKLGVGYKYKTLEGYTNTLEGINLENGKVIWNRELNREYGWNNIHYLNDSVVLIVAGGLNAVNIINGSGWEYRLTTGEKDYKATALANTAGVALGLLTGTFVISTGHNLVRDLVSNVLIDSTDLYIASKERISRVNKTSGFEVWSTTLPKDMPAKSYIFMNDSIIFMINYGYAYMGNRLLDYGKPFIAAFNKENGNQKFISVIFNEKDPILAVKVKEDVVYLMFKERISKHSLQDGSNIAEKTFNAKEQGDFINFIGNHVYTLKKDSSFISLPMLDPSKFYVYTNKGNVLALDDGFNIEEIIALDELYINFLRKNDILFLSKDNETIIIDSEVNRKIAELPISKNAFILGDKLYDIQQRSFFEISLDEITGLKNMP